MQYFLEQNSGSLMILILTVLTFGTLLVLVPQLLRARHQYLEMQHIEHMKALENGIPIPPPDERARAAGRTAALVPIVVVCAAATVTCFLSASRSESLFAVTLAVWCVAGVVGLAAITGGVALVGRLAQLQYDEDHQQVPDNPLQNDPNPRGGS